MTAALIGALAVVTVIVVALIAGLRGNDNDTTERHTPATTSLSATSPSGPGVPDPEMIRPADRGGRWSADEYLSENGYLGGIRMPPSTRTISAFMYELTTSSTTIDASSAGTPRRRGNRTFLPRLALNSLECSLRSVDRGVDQARHDGVHADTGGRQVTRERHGQTVDGTLGR